MDTSSPSAKSKKIQKALNEECGDVDSDENNSEQSLQCITIGEIIDIPEAGNLSISAVLHYCKCKILRPYLRLLSIMGLRSLTFDRPDCCSFMGVLSFLYTVLVIILMVVGYILQYMACFRRDRGFCYKSVHLVNKEAYKMQLLMQNYVEPKTYDNVCCGPILYTYIIPSVLHFVAYIYALVLFRGSNNEQLQSLMERVFLLSSSPLDRVVNKSKLVKILWLFVGIGIFWILMSLFTIIFMVYEEIILFQWMENRSLQLKTAMKILLIVCTILHDMVLATVITSYCLQAQLLKANLHFLKTKLVQQFVAPLDWMREISEFQNLLKYLNNQMAPTVCLFTLINITWAFSGIIWLLSIESFEYETVTILINLLNVCLWILVSVAPFVQAARLSSACIMIQGVGHEVRARPFAYQATPASELDSVLLFTSSLRMSAKLYKVPISNRYLLFFLTFSAFLIIILGQLHFFQVSF